MRYWKRTDTDGNTTTVESYNHDDDVDGAIEIDRAEHDGFVSSLKPAPQPEPRNLAAEVDELKAKLKAKGII